MYICFDYCFPFWCKKTKTPKSKRNTTFHRLYKSKMFFEAFLCAIFIGCPTVQYCGSPSVDIEGVHVSMFADLLLNAFTSRVEHWMVFSPVNCEVFLAICTLWKGFVNQGSRPENITKIILKRKLFHFSPVCNFQLRHTHTVCKFRPKCAPNDTRLAVFASLLRYCL